MSNGFSVGLCPLMRLLPGPRLVDLINEPRSSRLLRSPSHRIKQEDLHYYEPVRLRVPRRYSPPRASDVWGTPCRPAPIPGWTVSGHAIPRSTRKQQIKLAPPLRRTPPGQEIGHPPGSSRAELKGPVSMPFPT